MLKKWIEKINAANVIYIILIFEFINISYYLYHLLKIGYLPAPFVLDKNNTLMDFYNPLYWALKEEFYTSFNSIYPALNYYFLKIFALAGPFSHILTPFELRDNFFAFGFAISLAYIFIIWVVINIGEWQKVEFRHKWLLLLVCLMSSPVLFGIERGNLIFFALLFLALYLNATNEWLRAIYFGLLINIKPYFIILLIRYLNIHQINKVELTRSILIGMAIFFASGLLAGMNFVDFFKSYLFISRSNSIPVEGVIALPHSMAALSSIKLLIDFSGGSSYSFWFSLMKAANYIGIISLIFLCLTKKITKLELLIAGFILLTNFSVSTGGYILIIYLVLIPYLIRDKEYRYLLFYIILIYSAPLDWINILDLKYPYAVSYLSGGLIILDPPIFLSLMTILRPVLNFLLMIIFIWHLFKKYSKYILINPAAL